MHTTIELLGSQHQEVLARLAAIDDAIACSAADSDIAGFAGYLEQEVVHHFVVEEQALFPVLARRMGHTQGPLAVMEAEHTAFRQLMADLAAGLRSGDRDQQQHCAQDIIELLRDHIAKEDGVLFPMAARVLSPQELDEVDRRAAGVAPA